MANRIISGVPAEAIEQLNEELSRRPASLRSRPSSRAPSPDHVHEEHSGRRSAKSRGNSPPPLSSPRPSFIRHDHEAFDSVKGEEPTLRPQAARRKTVNFDEAPQVEHPAPVWHEERQRRRKLGTCVPLLSLPLFVVSNGAQLRWRASLRRTITGGAKTRRTGLHTRLPQHPRRYSLPSLRLRARPMRSTRGSGSTGMRLPDRPGHLRFGVGDCNQWPRARCVSRCCTRRYTH